MFLVEYECHFGQETTAAPYYGVGWSNPEPGFTWAVGSRAELAVPRPNAASEYMLEVWCSPCLRPNDPRPQRLIVGVNGTVVGAAHVADHTVLAFPVPACLVCGGIKVVFGMPDAVDLGAAADSHDTRILGFSFVRLRLFAVHPADHPPALPDRPGMDLLEAFESIGDNCEFGLAQRACTLEPMGLLRFSGQPTRYLVRGLDERFEAFREPDSVEIAPANGGTEMPIYVRPYHMHYHTHIHRGEMDAGTLLEKQRLRLIFLARKFLEDAATARKILVFKRNAWLHLAEILPVFIALRRLGPVNLLVARPADASHPAGSVEVLRPGLLSGYVTEFGVYGDPHVQSLADWRAICQAAFDLCRFQ